MSTVDEEVDLIRDFALRLQARPRDERARILAFLTSHFFPRAVSLVETLYAESRKARARKRTEQQAP